MEGAPESVRLFWLCENMNWSHLPVAGGLYDQHPRLIEEWSVIFQVKAEEERKQNAERERKSRRK